MSDYQSRVVEEREDLFLKVEKLGSFLSQKSDTVSDKNELAVLYHQLEHMMNYLQALDDRVNIHNGTYES